jgi:hypothetical protein
MGAKRLILVTRARDFAAAWNASGSAYAHPARSALPRESASAFASLAVSRSTSRVSHSQIITTRNPKRRKVRIAFASRRRLVVNLSRQKASLALGMVACLQPVC